MEFSALGFIEHVPDNFFIKIIFAFDSEGEGADNKSVCDNSQGVDVTLLRIFFRVFLIHFHDFRRNITHRAALDIDVVFVRFGSQSKITQHPLVLFLSVNYILRLDVSVHDMLGVEIVQPLKTVFNYFTHELTRVHAFVLHHVF